MRTVRMLGDRGVDVVDLPDPEPADDYVVVKVMSSAICGSERHAYEDGMHAGPGAARTVNAGHEATGVVWKATAQSHLKEGDRVNLFAARTHCGECRHCARGRWVLCQGEPPPPGVGYHSQFVLKRQDFCLPLAQDIDFETGALLGDVLGTAYHAIRRLRVTGADTVLVMGQGPIGLAATMLCRFFGAQVIAADRSDSRLALSRQCGAWETLNPTRDDVPARVQALIGPDGVDVAIDCAGAQASRLACLQSVVRGGRVGLVGLSDGLQLDQPTFMQNVFLKDLDLVASWYSNPSDMFELEALVRRGLDPGRMVTHTFGIEEAPAAYQTMFTGDSGKVMLDPWAS